MKASEIYDRYILKSEANGTNDNVSIDKSRFVEIYNESQYRFTEYIYDQKNEDDFRYIQSLLIKNIEIHNKKIETDHVSFELPKNYFDFSSAYALGSKGNCASKRIDLFYEIKDIERNFYLSDEFTKPSFEYREAPYMIGSNKVNVFYSKDFSIDSLILTYYRYPKPLRLQNPENPESDFDDSFEADFDEKAINRLISAAVSMHDFNNNSERGQYNAVFAKRDLM